MLCNIVVYSRAKHLIVLCSADNWSSTYSLKFLRCYNANIAILFFIFVSSSTEFNSKTIQTYLNRNTIAFNNSVIIQELYALNIC